MNKALFLVAATLLAFYPVQLFAQDVNSWGSVFDCRVDWFSQCKGENQTEEKTAPLEDWMCSGVTGRAGDRPPV